MAKNLLQKASCFFSTVGLPRILVHWGIKKGEKLVCIRSYSFCDRLLLGGSATPIDISVQSP